MQAKNRIREVFDGKAASGPAPGTSAQGKPASPGSGASFRVLWEADRDGITAKLGQSQDLAAAAGTVNRELGRALLRYNEREQDQRICSAAAGAIRIAQETVPLITGAGRVRAYRRLAQEGGMAAGAAYSRKRKLGRLFWPAILVAALACLAAVFLPQFMGGQDPPAVRAVPAALAVAAAFVAGAQIKKKAQEPDDSGLKFEIAPDAEDIYHTILSMLTVIDDELDELRADIAPEQEADMPERPAYGADREELELLAAILENAYADRGVDLADTTISDISFYLHKAGIEVEDYKPGNESWFTIMPSGRNDTVKPALIKDGEALVKGVATKK